MLRCPECKGFKLNRLPSSNPFFFVLQMLGGGGCLFLFIGFFFWPLLAIALPMMIIGGLGNLIVWLVEKEANYKCRNCGFIFKSKT